MAQLVAVSVVGMNGRLSAIPYTLDLQVNWIVSVGPNNYTTVPTGISTIKVLQGAAANVTIEYQVTEDQATIASAINAATVTGDMTLSGNLSVAGTSTFGLPIIRNGANTDVASGGTITAPQLAGGIITFTGAVGALALPSATDLATEISAVKGTIFDFALFNTAGTGTATLTAGAGTTAVSAVTGGTTLTLANSATAGAAGFRYTFISATVAILSRLY